MDTSLCFAAWFFPENAVPGSVTLLEPGHSARPCRLSHPHFYGLWRLWSWQRAEHVGSRLKAFVRARKLPLKLKKLTKAKLKLSRSKYPELRSSGYDSYVVLLWLQHEAESHAAVLPDALKTRIWAGDRAISVMCNAGHFLTELEESNKVTVGKVFLRSYMVLANEGLEAHRLIFRVKESRELWSIQHLDGRGRAQEIDEDVEANGCEDKRAPTVAALASWTQGHISQSSEKKLCAWRPVL